MIRYSGQTRVLVAVDCIIFGFDGDHLKILLIQRGFEPEIKKWSLMGGFIQPEESLDQAANRILKQLTGLEGVYLEQMQAFGDPKRDPLERTIGIVYFALIDIHQYEKQISHEYHAEWFLLDLAPNLIFDHAEMVAMAKQKLRYKAALHPILFELLPEKFTVPQLQNLYEGIYGASFDKRNFSRKLLSTGLLIRQKEKDKENSKKGAFYYILDKERYKNNFQAFFNFVPNPENLIL
ncbi:NUDIX hydrolase [Mucilaginibacter arboris]|uniref:NUDIX domain-containing protein n=1 Tax=Mucilaginibacter arboris TaxID=2682090 RepID=A0A7K1SZ34_9SPHI|nr:NUDIX domain-containing protein [Mucilaginibacter arboris]MVN22572.1 NUDIX domain-containing protein [Mucilaginibacter arboris]